MYPYSWGWGGGYIGLLKPASCVSLASWGSHVQLEGLQWTLKLSEQRANVGDLFSTMAQTAAQHEIPISYKLIKLISNNEWPMNGGGRSLSTWMKAQPPDFSLLNLPNIYISGVWSSFCLWPYYLVFARVPCPRRRVSAAPGARLVWAYYTNRQHSHSDHTRRLPAPSGLALPNESLGCTPCPVVTHTDEKKHIHTY